MNWRECLPGSRIELWILRIAFMIFIFGSGFAAGLIYSKDNFQRGLDYMQDSYTRTGVIRKEFVKVQAATDNNGLPKR